MAIQKPINEIRKEKLINDFVLNNKIDLSKIKSKFISIDFYSNKKVCLCYEKLKTPKINYFLMDINDSNIYLINKTIYEYLENIKEDLENLKTSLKNSCINDDLFNRFKNVDFKRLNYLNNGEKISIEITRLFYENKFKDILEILKNGI